MVKRLQVLLDDDELREVQSLARRHRMTTAAWVRRALRESIGREPRPDSRAKLAAIRRAASHGFPTGEIEEMLDEIERGYVDDAGMIFVDSNIPMYVVGAEHPNKAVAIELLERAAIDGEVLVTDAEVFQELLHRYSAIGRRDAVTPAFDVLSSVVDDVFPIDRGVVERARVLVTADQSTSARDAVHLAVMRTHRITRVMSFDRGFDRVEGIERIPT